MTGFRDPGRQLATTLVLLALAACGGGGGGSTPVAPEPPANRALKASAGSTTSTLSSLSTATLLAIGGGRVTYGEGGKTYTWAASTGQTTLRLDTAPGQVFIAGGALVFTVGPSVYRVGLE